MTLAQFEQFGPYFDADILEVVKVENSVAARTSEGGGQHQSRCVPP